MGGMSQAASTFMSNPVTSAWSATKADLVGTPVAAHTAMNNFVQGKTTIGEAANGVAKAPMGPGSVPGQLMAQPEAAPMPVYSQPTQSELDAQRVASARQSQVDLRTDRPGRDQTMLADNSAYPYRMT